MNVLLSQDPAFRVARVDPETRILRAWSAWTPVTRALSLRVSVVESPRGGSVLTVRSSAYPLDPLGGWKAAEAVARALTTLDRRPLWSVGAVPPPRPA